MIGQHGGGLGAAAYKHEFSPVVIVSVALFLAISFGTATVYAHFSFNWPQAEDFFILDWYRRAFVVSDLRISEIIGWANGPHPIGALVLLVLGIEKIFGVGLTAVLLVAYGMLICSAAALAWLASRDLPEVGLKIAVWAILPLAIFHPMQTNHLLWPFEICWFLITTSLVLSLVLNEVGGRWGPWLSIMPCVVAMFSSAHGSLLPLFMVVQLLLLPHLGRVNRSILVAIYLAIFVAGRIWLPDYGRPFSWPQNVGIGAFLIYCFQLVGGMFGYREPRLVFCLGVLTVVICAIPLFFVRSSMKPSARVGLLLVLAGTLFVGTFALGRVAYGLPWALSGFHVAPLMAPFWLGTILISANVISRRWEWQIKVPAFLAIMLIAISILTSAFDAHARAVNIRINRAIGMVKTCEGNSPDYLLAAVNALPGNLYLLRSTEPLLRQYLCTREIPASVRGLIFPESYKSLVGENSELEGPFATLWNVYISHGDLMQAFPIEKASTPCNLATFAFRNAQSGSKYEPALLGPHAEVYSNTDLVKKVCSSR